MEKPAHWQLPWRVLGVFSPSWSPWCPAEPGSAKGRPSRQTSSEIRMDTLQSTGWPGCKLFTPWSRGRTLHEGLPAPPSSAPVAVVFHLGNSHELLDVSCLKPSSGVCDGPTGQGSGEGSSGTRAGILGRVGRLRRQAHQCPELLEAGEWGRKGARTRVL